LIFAITLSAADFHAAADFRCQLRAASRYRDCAAATL